MSRIASRLAQRGKQESGVILVLTAILMVVFLGMAALAIDVGSFYQAQRQAQAAADAGALAALNDLPTSPTLAGADATTYAQQTFPGSSVVPTSPATTGGSATTIKVVVTKSTPSFFGNIFGITSVKVSARRDRRLPAWNTPPPRSSRWTRPAPGTA
jgi:Flp pilus assembly protein TadG